MPIKIRDGGAWKLVSDAAGGGEFFSGTTKVARIWDQKPTSDGAGTPTHEAWRTRTLNTKEDPSTFVTLESGIDGGNKVFSLPSGSYRISWRAPAHDGNKMRTRLRYSVNTDFSSSTDILGESGLSDTASSESNYYSCGSKTITITQKTYFAVQQYQDAGNWGQASQIGDYEIYTQVFIEDLATAVKDNVVAATGRVAKLYQTETKGTGGGTYANPSELGTWKNRTLNTKTDPKSFVTLDSGNVFFSVPEGSYKIKWDTPAYMLGNFQSRLQYDDNSSFSSPTSVLGSTEHAPTNAGVLNAQLSSTGIAVFTVSENTYVRIQIQGSGTPGDANALGKPSDIDTEIYTQVSVEDLATAVQTNADYVAGTTKVAVLWDQRTQGTDAGDFINGAWRDRTLNQENDPQTFVTLDSGNVFFSLAAGTYEIGWNAPGYRVNTHQTRLAYDDNSSFTSPTYVMGSSEESPAVADESQTRSFGETILTLTETTYFKIQHRCQTSESINGLGHASDFANEVYTQVRIKDLATAVKNASPSVVKQIKYASGPATQTSYNSGSWTTILQNEITTTGDKVLATVKAGFYGGDEGTVYQGGKLVRTTGGADTTLWEVNTIWARAVGTLKAAIDGPIVDDTPPAGTHTYKWQTYQHDASGSNDVVIFANGNSITLMEHT